MKKIYLILTLTVLVLAASVLYFFYLSSPDGKSGEKSETSQVSKQYSLEMISSHSTPQDCWFAIEGKVYDVTKFIASERHPGGVAILQGCGKDATVLFNTRPMGTGLPHSDDAREGLKNFLIGELQ